MESSIPGGSDPPRSSSSWRDEGSQHPTETEVSRESLEIRGWTVVLYKRLAGRAEKSAIFVAIRVTRKHVTS